MWIYGEFGPKHWLIAKISTLTGDLLAKFLLADVGHDLCVSVWCVLLVVRSAGNWAPMPATNSLLSVRSAGLQTAPKVAVTKFCLQLQNNCLKLPLKSQITSPNRINFSCPLILYNVPWVNFAWFSRDLGEMTSKLPWKFCPWVYGNATCRCWVEQYTRAVSGLQSQHYLLFCINNI